MKNKLLLLSLTTLVAVHSLFGQVDVTFQVDMSNEVISENGVHIVGTINDWDPGATQMFDADGDGIYTVTLPLTSGSFQEFKFVNDNDWPGVETPGEICAINTNRYVYVPFENVTLPAVDFNGCASSGVSNVTFSVDLNGETANANGVHLVGYVSGWNPGILAMSVDPTNSNIYSVTKQYRVGEYLEYKFVNDNDWPGAETPGSDCQISDNRFIVVPGEDIALTTVPFNGCAGTAVTFQVDLLDATPSLNGIHLVGNFNNWNPSNVLMTNSSGNIYSKTFVFALEGAIEYKYVNGIDFSVAETPGLPCSMNTNRQYFVGSTSEVLASTNFGGCDFDYLTYKDEAWSNSAGPVATDNVSIEGVYEDAGFECNDLYVYNNINPNASIEITVNGDLVNNHTIELPSGSSLVTMNAISGNGDFIIHRNTRFDENTGKYSIVGSPVTSATTSDLGDLVYEYIESVPYGSNAGLDRFNQLATDVALLSGVGYFSAFTGEMTFSGIPNNGDIAVPLSYTSGAEAGFNLLSNPYPCAVDAEAFIASNTDITGTLYIWDDQNSDSERGTNSDYIIINELGVAGNITRAGNQGNWDGFIRSGQGFFVQSKPTGGSALFTNSIKSTTNSDAGFFRKANSPTLRLILSNEDAVSDALVGLSSQSTTAEDQGLDARRFASSHNLSVFTLIDDEQYAIQALPFTDEFTTIKIGFSANSAGEYELRMDNALSRRLSSIQFYDNYLNKTITLSNGLNAYKFETEAGTFTDRFSIVVGEQSIITGLDIPTSSYPFKASIYSIQGKLLREVTFKNDQQFDLLRGLEGQLLIMKTPTETKKIWIDK